ncbi:MAG: hypothetical protein GY765_38750, partial [bacterium]|nr:hypothetical protein [bacterium]
MRLPAQLAQWEEQLTIFDDKLIPELGRLLRPLDMAIGPPGTHREADEGEPDGFHGIANKGDYSRLLASEWLLADTFPDEFLRKASSGEHLFLRPSFTKPHGSALSVVLLDSGPTQLGNPRILQMALLIVMAKRAQQAGAMFAWGSLQQDRLVESPGKKGIGSFLRARTAVSLHSLHVETWKKNLEDMEQDTDLWIIGSPFTHTLFPNPQYICIKDVPEPGVNEVEARIHKKSRTHLLRLPLPDAKVCKRLLTDPFKPPQPLKKTVSYTTTHNRPLYTYYRARKQVLFAAPDHLKIFKVPSCRADIEMPAASYKAPPGHTILGVTFKKRRFVLLTSKGGTLFLYNTRMRAGSKLKERNPAAVFLDKFHWSRFISR